MMKKLLQYIFLSLLTLSILIGCSQKEDVNDFNESMRVSFVADSMREYYTAFFMPYNDRGEFRSDEIKINFGEDGYDFVENIRSEENKIYYLSVSENWKYRDMGRVSVYPKRDPYWRTTVEFNFFVDEEEICVEYVYMTPYELDNVSINNENGNSSSLIEHSHYERKGMNADEFQEKMERYYKSIETKTIKLKDRVVEATVYKPRYVDHYTICFIYDELGINIRIPPKLYSDELLVDLCFEEYDYENDWHIEAEDIWKSTNRQSVLSDFVVVDNLGNKVKLSDFKGKPIVLYFWTTQNEDSKKELKCFEEASKKYMDVQFVIINLTCQSGESLNKAKKYIEDNNYTFEALFDTRNDAVSSFKLKRLWNEAVPSMFCIDESGKVIKYWNNENHYFYEDIWIEEIEEGIMLITEEKSKNTFENTQPAA